MRLALLLLAVFLVLGGGAAGAYFYFTNTAEAAADPAADHAAAHPDQSGAGSHSNYAFVELDPLLVPVVDSDGVSQVVSFVIGIEVFDITGADKVQALSPRLKNAFIQDMYGVLNRYAALKGGMLEVEAIKQRLNKITVDILGADVVHDVQLKAVQQRPV